MLCAIDQFPEEAYSCPECHSEMTPLDEADGDSKPWYCNECGFNDPEELAPSQKKPGYSKP